VQFLHYLATTPTVTVDEGARAALLTAGPTEQWPTFEARVAELQRQGAIDEDWATEADETLSMGTLAYMLAVVCDVPAGVNMRVSEVTGIGRRRYALRACVDAGLLPYAIPDQPVRGGELVTAVNKCAERRE
jgi:hypothetical protein